MKSIAIPLSDHERNEVFKADAEAIARSRQALSLVQSGRITRPRFLRLIYNYQGEALARFARRCATIARHQLTDGWGATEAANGGGL